MKNFILTAIILMSVNSFAETVTSINPNHSQKSIKASPTDENTITIKQISLEMKNGKRLNLLDIKRKNTKYLVEITKVELNKEAANTNGGGWQPEQNSFKNLENEVKEFLRMSAQENCSGQAISQALQETFGDNLDNQTIDISSLPTETKMCLEK